MGLRLKFNLVLGFTSLIGLLAAGLFTYNSLQRNARAEILESARIMMESAIAVRGYTVSEIRPLLAVQQRRQFMPQSVPAYAASRYVSEFRKNRHLLCSATNTRQRIFSNKICDEPLKNNIHKHT